MLLDDMQQASAVLDEERFRHRRDDICPHYATLYEVSGLHFFFVLKKEYRENNCRWQTCVQCLLFNQLRKMIQYKIQILNCLCKGIKFSLFLQEFLKEFFRDFFEFSGRTQILCGLREDKFFLSFLKRHKNRLSVKMASSRVKLPSSRYAGCPGLGNAVPLQQEFQPGFLLHSFYGCQSADKN